MESIMSTQKRKLEKAELPNGKVTTNGETSGGRKLKIWHSRVKDNGARERTAVASLAQLKKDEHPCPLVVERRFDDKHRLESTTLEVNSPHVLKVFQNVVGTYPTLTDFTEPFTIEVPSELFFHHWDDLKDYRDKCEDGTTRLELDELLDFMDFDMGPTKRSFDSQARVGLVEYKRLNMLFRPGDLIVYYHKSQPWLLRVLKSAYEEKPSCGDYFELHCEYSDYDGTDHGTSKKVFTVLQKQFFGQGKPCKITDLAAYPVQFMKEDHEDLKARLHKRGSHYQSFAGVSTHQYDGQAEWLKKSPFDFFHQDEEHFPQVWLPHHESGRVVVDRKTYEQETYKAQVTKLPVESLEKITYAPYVFGYSCNRKQWCRLYIEHLRNVDWKLDAFDGLILPTLKRSMLRALISSHQFPDEHDARDETKQKGKGLVILLHGPPGSGKTMSAECSAEISKKALFSTSLSELNKFNSPWEFEKNLAEVMRLATIWKSIVLFDEADVFLEARKTDGEGAQQRNSMVAVFLRHLEYFSGIVFLTTNRMQVFDAAMKSRVHLALSYEEPDQQARRQIWRKNLDKIPSRSDGELRSALDTLAAKPLNGREITNTIGTACTLARYEHEPLGVTHLDQVLSVRQEFDTSLVKLRLSENTTSNKPEVKE
ncbi:P-loop containing nucleoside triphosphate hydrolase protein [Myriangium duriaei CBS 260.36]|uniref:P-loop containing nucleoside triphosphate hydrolase protein n=1 Tax=Myriangium duriaei CBS 260.36 TaxID=1168546 RepID=A0A9P4IT58_9PEZI|nr:P-loop containing nucleoside triphosphate hydrolase protein [Myriangium duriaei CBS 260.36]